MVINMAGRQQRDRRGVQGQHVCLRPQVSGGGVAGVRRPWETKPVPTGWTQCRQGPWASLPSSAPPATAVLVRPWHDQPFRPSILVLLCFNEQLSSHLSARPRGRLSLGTSRLEESDASIFPPGKVTICSGHDTAPCEGAAGEQNLCGVTLTSTPDMYVLVCYSGTMFSCSPNLNQN